jgi:hypothetical protein
MTDQDLALAALGHARVAPARLDDIVAGAVNAERAVVLDVDVTAVDYPTFSIATGALLRVRGNARTGEGDVRPFRLFVKQLHSARHWPLLDVVVPPAAQDSWIEGFPWRIEIDAFESDVTHVLPDGMRTPELYAIDEIGSDRAAIWMEDVDADPEPWAVDRFERAAFLLGALAGRRPVGSAVRFGDHEEHHAPGFSFGMYVDNRVRLGSLPMLNDDDIWRHPALLAVLQDSGEHHLRDELRARIPLLDGLLVEMNQLPQTYVHGDACPQNLLVPRDDPDTFVVIDWSFNSPQCVGFDLGQLLMGLANSGLIPASRLPGILGAIVPAYVDGLASTGFDVTSDEVRRGFLMSLLVRDLYSTIPLEQLGQPDTPVLRELLTNRVAMARFLLGLADEIS